MSRSRRPTLEDVAAECGVSRATVSRVLNRHESVSGETAEVVERAMRKLGYISNASARVLAGGPSRTLAVVLPQIWREYYSSLLQGIEETASKRDYHVLIKTKARRQSLTSLILSNRIDGLLIRNTVPSSGDERFYRELAQLRVPYLHIGSPLHGQSHGMVAVDNLGGGRAAAVHLAQCECSRVLVITGPGNHLDSMDRVSGFKLGWSESGGDPGALEYREGDYGKESGYKVAKSYFQHDNADAVFACNDRMALGVLVLLKEMGSSVPHDVAVVGFDDDFFSAHISPSLTTVRQPFYDMGAIAASNLILLLEGTPLENPNVILKAELRQRESTTNHAFSNIASRSGN